MLIESHQWWLLLHGGEKLVNDPILATVADEVAMSDHESRT